MPFFYKYIKPFADFSITIFLWCFFLIGYATCFLFYFMPAYFFSGNHQAAFQNLNHRFLKIFFWVMETIAPGLKFKIDERIPTIHSSVVVCNHRSYLDPILLISLFKVHTTIVKNIFFRAPIFSQILNLAGYIPSPGNDRLYSLMMRRIKALKQYLDTGGVLFIFPEGTRSRNGRIGTFNKGAFKIARRCNAKIHVLSIENTERLFQPGKFLFNTCSKNTIEVRWGGSISPQYNKANFSITKLMDDVRDMMENTGAGM